MMAVAKTMRWAGFILMLVTLGLAIGAKRGLIGDFGPVPVVAVAIILGGTAILLILNDIAIRGMRVQMEAARLRAEAEAEADAEALAQAIINAEEQAETSAEATVGLAPEPFSPKTEQKGQA